MTMQSFTTEKNMLILNPIKFLWIELTEKCNLFCIHCYNDSNPHKELRGKMKLDDWKKVISEAYQLGCRSIQFIGGEATIHPDLEELIEFSSNLGYDFIELFSNLTIISESLISTLKKHNVRVAGSFYSADPDTHDAITQRKGSHCKTIKGITKIVEQNIPLRIGVIEMKENKGHFPECIEFLRALGVSANNISTDRLRQYGRGQCSGVQLDDQYAELCGQCGKDKLCITSSGGVHPCIMSRMVIVGDIKENCLQDLLVSEQLISFKTYMKERTNLQNGCPPMPGCAPDKCSPQTQCYPDKTDCTPDKCSPIRS